jgi:3'-phosphoadenosine 5'-phosphosulfate sulfotransferase (PAPS reductase)/FAD synthetase
MAGVSGGKDSDVLGILANKFLKAIDYPGERILIHADLGVIEHAESIDQVRRLAEFINWKLVIVRREKGDLLDRYEQRWHDNCVRYADLSCINLISPYPQSGSPFCRSDVKVAPILQKAATLFPGKTILNLVGLRAEESAKRASNPVSRPNPKLKRSDGTNGHDWYPLLSMKVETIWLIHRQVNFLPHPQYARGNSRISCAYCFLASQADWKFGSDVTTNHESYRRITSLELRSGFSYQQNHWLADIRPDLINAPLAIAAAKEKARTRKLAEQAIPSHMLFKNDGGLHGWPQRQPSMADCEILAQARHQMSKLMGSEIKATTGKDVAYTTALDVYNRYAELLALKDAKTELKLRRGANKRPQRYDNCYLPPKTSLTGAQPQT